MIEIDASFGEGGGQVLRSALDRNDKVNKIVSNAEEFGGIILTLLGKFV